jgi:acyl-CoA reductase-like NAD-dependent aldehyde dehydrogenase
MTIDRLQSAAMTGMRGNYISGAWVRPTDGRVVRSVDPSTSETIIAEAISDPAQAHVAAEAANAAQRSWFERSIDARYQALLRFADALDARVEAISDAMTSEMGKLLDEARTEVRSLPARIRGAKAGMLETLRPSPVPDADAELRYHPLGVVAILGPFNFPLHLLHAHVVPALLAGNTVVLKPSERTPLTAQRYMEAWDAADLPPVLNMVQGGGEVGAALVEAPAVRGVVFTGSWHVGHAIQRATLSRPEVLVALEMGGQNMAYIAPDADLELCLEGLVTGAFLTTGQRCTCTCRALVHRDVAERLMARLIPRIAELTWGDPRSDVFMGPLASLHDRDRVDALCQSAVDAGAEVLLAGTRRDGGAFRGPSVHLIEADHDSDYTRQEIFGPDLAITIVDNEDEACRVINASPFGLSLAVFSASRDTLDAVYRATRAGCVNWNRSTSRATGALPFGGVGRSGNYRPAGADAFRNVTYPVQLQWTAPTGGDHD